MRYSSYKLKYASKIKKLNLLYKFRFVLAGAGALIIATTTTLLGVKGKVGETALDKTTYTYGETINVTSSALMAKYSVEYSVKSKDEWTTSQPTRPGEYKARAVSKSGFGKTKYGKEQYFTIVPADLRLNIQSSSIIYGEDPALDLSDAKAKQVSVNEVSFTYGQKFDEVNPFGVDKTFSEDVALAKEKVRIADKSGVDVTDCFNIISEPKTISVSKRALVIDVKNKTKAYDGAGLVADDYEVNSAYTLASGDNIHTSNATSIGAAIGSGEARIDFAIYHGDKDKTAFYDITVNSGQLEIRPRELLIKTNSINRLYNGEVLSSASEKNENKLYYDVEGDGLLPNHHINAVFDAENVYITNSGAINNSLSSYQILDEGNNPVDPSIYHVEVSTGHISIGKITLEINFDKKEKYYDGEGLEGSYTINGQKASTDRIEVSGLSKDNSPGSTEYGNIAIYNDELFSSPRDVTVECYNVLVNRSELTIKKRVITVKTNAIERTVYNGQPLSSSPTAPSDSKLSYTVEGELFPGHHIRINSYALEGRYIVSGEQNSVNFDIVDANNVVKTSESYYVVNPGVFPTVNIGKQNINLVFDTSAKTYNGSNFEIPFSVGSGRLASTDEIKIKANSNIVDKNPGTHVFAPEVEIYRKNTEIKMTDYYNISYSGGSSVKVNKVNLTISTNAVNETYDGVAFSSSPSARSDRKLSYTVQGLLPSHHLADVVFTHEGDFRPIYDVNEISYDIEDENGDSVKSVYNIHEDFKAFNIYRRDISVSFNNTEKPYDGSVLTPSPSINGVLASGDQLQSVSTYDSDVGTYPYSSYSLRITNPSNGDVTNCYNISYANYEFVIRQRNIFVKSQDINKIYDSTPLTVGNQSDNLRIQEYGNSEHLLDNLNHHFVVYYYRQGLIDCCSNISNDFILSVEDAVGNDVTGYYSLNLTSGKININKRDISITFNNKNIVFDGENHGYDNSELTVTGLASNDTLVCSHRDAGTYFGNDLFDITRSAMSVKSNYDMHIDSSKKLTIEKLQIEYYLSTSNASNTITKTYDGHPLAFGDAYSNLTPHISYLNGSLLPSGYTAEIQLMNDSQHNITDATPSGILDYKLVIKNGAGYPISNAELNNFAISKKNVGNINYVINKATLNIVGAPFDKDKTYDGTPLKQVADVGTISGLADTDEVLSEEFEYSSETYFTNGEVNIDLKTFKVRNASDGRDVTSNYNLPTNLGTYDVSKRNITIVLDDLNKVYDSEPFRKGDISYAFSGNTLATGDKLTYDIDGTYKNVTGGTLFSLKDVKITRGNVDVTSSYNITVQKAQCVITQRPISFKALSYSKVYDGSSINESNYHLGYVYTGALCGGHDVQFTFNTISNTKDVGVHENKIISASIQEGQTDVTGNYYVTTYDGTVSIEQRVIKYRIYDTAFVYDGKDRNVDKVVTFDELGNTNVVRITNNFGDDPNVTEFLSNSTFSTEFTYDGAPNDVVDNGNYYTFFYDGTYATHSFSGVIYITVDGTTYTSTSGVTTGNVKFEKDISSEDNLLTYTASKRNLVISNAEMKRVFLYGSKTNNLEQIYCSNLASGDVLLLRKNGDEYEQYSSSKKEYALIEVNGEILPVGTDYVRGANFINYLNATAVANKDIKIMHGNKDVTNAYNISFNFQDTILFDVIAV